MLLNMHTERQKLCNFVHEIHTHANFPWNAVKLRHFILATILPETSNVNIEFDQLLNVPDTWAKTRALSISLHCAHVV